MTDRPTAEQRNEAAERLLIDLNEIQYAEGPEGWTRTESLNRIREALAAERRATVERIWNRLLALTDGVPEGQLDERQVFAILDAEAER